MVIVIFGFLIVTIPSYFDYPYMKNNYDNAMSERAKVIELNRDLERMKQIEVVVQKALGSNLIEDSSLDEKLGEFQNNEELGRFDAALLALGADHGLYLHNRKV